MSNIIIEGFMGSGKTAVGKALAKMLEWPLIDIDKRVTEKMHLSVSEINDRYGEAYYHAMETFVLKELIEHKTDMSIIVVGSALTLLPQNLPLLKELGTVVCLKVKVDTIVERLSKSDKHSWLKTGDIEERVVRMLKEREPSYLKAADLVIDTDGKAVRDIAAEIQKSM